MGSRPGVAGNVTFEFEGEALFPIGPPARGASAVAVVVGPELLVVGSLKVVPVGITEGSKLLGSLTCFSQ
jgi:hypothetical protein